MTLPTNGITPEVIRSVMPPYTLSTDLLAAMFAAVPAPPPTATMAWRQERATRLVHEVAGLMPADAPQARIAAEIVIAREAADASFARSNTPGLAVEQVCRLLRIGSVLLNSAAVLERTLVRHQQKPAPFFGTVLAEGIDVAALAAGGGRAGSRPDGAEVPRAGEGAPAEGAAATEAGGALGQKGRVEQLGRGPLQRGAVQVAGSARMGKHDKDPGARLPGAGLGSGAAGIAAAGALGQKGRVEELGRGPLQRGAVGVAGSARMGKHDKDPTPMQRLPGAGLGARAAGIAAATEAGGAGTAAGVVSARQGSGPGDGRTVEAGRAAALAAKGGAACEVSVRNSLNSGAGGGTASADAIMAALPNRAARRRWKSLQRRAHPAPWAIDPVTSPGSYVNRGCDS